jgi:aspartyl-tRNA(Asn)/glutamyl-tRNA(Gln) amidotransferase subunit B
VPNREAFQLALLIAKALNCDIAQSSSFYRKNYTYVDLPKNYQISMYEAPDGSRTLARNGFLDLKVKGEKKRIGIWRVQLEEDPARNVFKGSITSSPETLGDYNRSGVALCEIVTAPDISSPKEARIFAQKLRSIVEHLGITDGSLQGSMRFDSNISVGGGKTAEVKNISSFKAIQKALSFEISRQKSLRSRGLAIARETRHYDELRKVTVSLRSKETVEDYRYFRDPDLMPIRVDDEMIESVDGRMTELPDARAARFVSRYGLPEYDAGVLTATKRLADFFEECVAISHQTKKASNWIMTEVLGYLNEKGLELADVQTTPRDIADLITLIDEATISGKMAKGVLKEMLDTGKGPKVIVEARNMTKIADLSDLQPVVDEVFAQNPKAVQDALADQKARNYLVGQVMSRTKGRADPEATNAIIAEKLAKIAK